MNLGECLLCMTHSSKYSSSAIIHIDYKPNITFQAEQWKPKEIKVLFLGESPPYHHSRNTHVNDSYFFNPHENNRFLGAPSPLLGTLPWNVFDLLGLKRSLSKSEKLFQFKQKSCYYIEAVKCRIERVNNKSLINRTVKNCSRYLEKELEQLQPKTVVVMGERALFGLKCCKFVTDQIPITSINTLMKQTIQNPIQIDKANYYFIPIPIWRNKKYLEDIQTIFNQINKALQ